MKHSKMKYYKSKSLIRFPEGVINPDGRIYNYVCQCSDPDRYILVNDPNFNCEKWSKGVLQNPSDSFVSEGVFGTKMNITDGGLSFEISVDTSNEDVPVEENATNLLRGKGRVHTTLNNINKSQSRKFYQFPVNKKGI